MNEKTLIRLSSGGVSSVDSVEALTRKYGNLRVAQGIKLDPALMRRVAPVSLLLESDEGLVLLRTLSSRGDAALEQLRMRLREAYELSEEFCSASVLQAFTGETGRSAAQPGPQAVVSSTLHDSLFREIISTAMEMGASDVHFRVRNSGGEDSAKVLFRIDGELELSPFSLSPRQAHEVVAAGFAKSDVRSLASGEGQFNVQIPLSSFIRIPDLKNVELRFQSAPERYGFDVAIRVLNFEGKLKGTSSIADLGYTKSQQRTLLEFGHGPGGAVLFVGETGSGKTTALNALISTHPRVVDGTAYASTLEDPPEGRPPGVSQFAVARSAASGGTGDANPFVSALRVRMRSDGDLIAVGEIRDSSTAEMFAQISMTGHKAFASLHAASSKGAYERLVSPMMGLSAETVGSEDVLALVVFQKLVPRLCPHCRIPVRKAWTSEEQVQRLARLEGDFGLDCSGVYVRNHAGCPHCHLGRKGVQVVAEMFSPSEHQRALISEGRIAKAFQDWRRSRKASMDSPEMHGKTTFEVGLYFVSRGIIGADTLDEQVGRILQHEVVK